MVYPAPPSKRTLSGRTIAALPSVLSMVKIYCTKFNILLYELYVKDKLITVKKSLSMRRENYISD